MNKLIPIVVAALLALGLVVMLLRHPDKFPSPDGGKALLRPDIVRMNDD